MTPAVSAATARSTRKQEVTATYVESWSATAQAMDARRTSRARAVLSRYFTADLVTLTITYDKKDWAAGEINYGAVFPHILGVRISRQRAFVHDCLDLSHSGLQKASTGQVTGGFGRPRMNVIVTLTRLDGRWLISNMTPVLDPCKP